MARRGEVRRAQRAFEPGNHRLLKGECAAGNRYVLAKLARLGLTYDSARGVIYREETGCR